MDKYPTNTKYLSRGFKCMEAKCRMPATRTLTIERRMFSSMLYLCDTHEQEQIQKLEAEGITGTKEA